MEDWLFKSEYLALGTLCSTFISPMLAELTFSFCFSKFHSEMINDGFLLHRVSSLEIVCIPSLVQWIRVHLEKLAGPGQILMILTSHNL